MTDTSSAPQEPKATDPPPQPPDDGGPGAQAMQKEAKRKRPRNTSLKVDREKIAQRVVDFYRADVQARSMDIEARLQRYAKYRMWSEGKDWPWEDASDLAMPDMMTHSLKVQDTIHNAIMSTRPPVISNAFNKADTEQEDNVDQLLDFQFFVENQGEKIASEMIDAFVNDGVITVFIPWVREERETHDVYTLPEIPDAETPESYFAKFIQGKYKGKIFKKKDRDGWSWEMLDDERQEWFTIDFYTVGNEIEMDARKMATVFDAPRPMVKDYEDVVHPVRAANLQIPSPSNPGGASHVALVDYPTLDEIKRLKKSGFYDLLTDEELKRLEAEVSADQGEISGQQEKEQKDIFQGAQATIATQQDGLHAGQNPDHKVITRLMCFDLYDVDQDGVNEDMIWWVLKEPKVLVKAKELTQVYPSNPPRRPFAEAAFIPIRGRRAGISLLEMMEGLHDAMKQFFDQTIDGGTIKNVPFFFYRAASNVRPETIRMWPGEGYPLADPKNDVYFPQFSNQGDAFGLNLVTMLGQMEERLTNIGDLQLGRVPQGKASALRTVRGMQSVLGQGDARPERILRRFFMCLAEVYAQMHELNRTFLTRAKQILVNGVKSANEDPYRSIDPAKIQGRFQFDFTANAMNTSKEAMQQALDGFGQAVMMNPTMVQEGVSRSDGLYQWARDMGKAHGLNPDKYVTPPTPESDLPKMKAEEVISLIAAGNMPMCRPAEATPDEHLEKLMDWAATDDFGHLTPVQVNVFKAYLIQMNGRIQQAQQQQAKLEAAQQFQKQQRGNGTPGPQGNPDMTPAPVGENQLMDESLPGAGGGANPGMTQ
jgi:hypothetical protein